MAAPFITHIYATINSIIIYAYLKVKGVAKPSGGVNIVYGESLPVISEMFPVGVSSQVHPLRVLA